MPDFPKFTDKIAENMKKSSQSCYDNGNDLLDEANILYDQKHYARATSLAILAEEEFSKAMVLQLSSINKRWDKELHEGLVNHEKKQAVSGAMCRVMDAYIRHLSRAKFSLVPMPFNLGKQTKDEIGKAEKTYIKGQKKDKKKQDAQFIAIGRTGLPCRSPKSFTKKDAEEEIDSATKFRAYLDALYGKLSDDYPLFRGSTILEFHYETGVSTLKHESGITILMKPFAWVDTGCNPDKDTMNPHIALKEFDTFDPKRLDDAQKTKLARIYRTYDFPGQIRAEMHKFGLKGTDFLDEVEGLIKKYAK